LTTFFSHSEAETIDFARNLSRQLVTPAFVCLYGNLGSGKTVFAKGLAEAFGIENRKIKSPTYTFVRHYKATDINFYHFDFYRLVGADDLMKRDLEEIFSQKDAIIVMEWPEHVKEILPRKRIDVKFEYIDEITRSITVKNDRK
jgi:tRNA threonylcarbamoyladenosine biosynthesis protein TsaE